MRRFTRSVHDVRTLSQAASVSVPGVDPEQRTARRRGRGGYRRNGLANAPSGRQHRAGGPGTSQTSRLWTCKIGALRGAGLVFEGLTGLHAALRRGAVVQRAPHEERGQLRHCGRRRERLMAHDSNKAYTQQQQRRTRQGLIPGRYSTSAKAGTGDFITTRSIHNNGTLRSIHNLRAWLRGDDGGTQPTRTGPSAKVH